MVKRAAESLEAVGFKTCSFALGSGIPKVVILDEAKKWGADLMVHRARSDLAGQCFEGSRSPSSLLGRNCKGSSLRWCRM